MKTEIASALFCLAYGHNYFSLKQTDFNTPELICKCCKRYFTYNTHDEIVEVNHKTTQITLRQPKKAV